ncbi:MAG: hypothetical protein KW788_02025 [Candidatus Doudnabacteria bacterium]|nr:hypothetical protein [Candidatus Doudnabacteria bacterium]
MNRTAALSFLVGAVVIVMICWEVTQRDGRNSMPAFSLLAEELITCEVVVSTVAETRILSCATAAYDEQRTNATTDNVFLT